MLFNGGRRWLLVALLLSGLILLQRPLIAQSLNDLEQGLRGLFNAPVPKEWLSKPYLMTSYQEDPKYLDSASSYSNNETPWTYAVYEPPLKYHYLKRPYELLPRTLARMPDLTFFDQQGRDLKIDPNHLKDITEEFDQRLHQRFLNSKSNLAFCFNPIPLFTRTTRMN